MLHLSPGSFYGTLRELCFGLAGFVILMHGAVYHFNVNVGKYGHASLVCMLCNFPISRHEMMCACVFVACLFLCVQRSTTVVDLEHSKGRSVLPSNE